MPFNLRKLKRKLRRSRNSKRPFTRGKRENAFKLNLRKLKIRKLKKKLRKGVNPIPKKDPFLGGENPDAQSVERTACGSLTDDQQIILK